MLAVATRYLCIHIALITNTGQSHIELAVRETADNKVHARHA